MEKHIVSFIWRYSKIQQLRILALTILSFPILYVTLELPKVIINDAIAQPEVLHTFFSIELSSSQYLLLLSVTLFFLIIANGILKMRINVYKGKVGERLVRRLRYMLTERTLRFPLSEFSRFSQGEVIATIISETKALADYAAESVALPLYMGGTFLTIMTFMFMQNWMLGLASVALMPLQMYIIPKYQKRLNKLKLQRVLRVRALSQRLGESVAGIQEIRVHGTQRYTMAEYSYRLGEIYHIRLQIFNTKYFMKFLANTIGHVTPLFFYSIGGLLVISGDITLGALVAALAAYKDILSPWKELLNYYQLYHDAVLRFEQVINQFNPVGLFTFKPQQTANLALGNPESFKIQNLSQLDENGEQVFASINLEVKPGEIISIYAPDVRLRNTFSRAIGLLDPAHSGQILFDDTASHELGEPELRRRLAYIGPQLFFFDASVSYNFAYALNHLPPTLPEHSKKISSLLKESETTGNSTDWFDESFDSLWTDFSILGISQWKDDPSLMMQVLKVVGGEEPVYAGALQEKFNPYQLESASFDDVPDALLEARALTRKLIIEKNLQHLIQPFDEKLFNPFATMAENLLFGTFGHNSIEVELLAPLPELESCLVSAGILPDILRYTWHCMRFILDIHTDLPTNDRMVMRLRLRNEEQINHLKSLLNKLSGRKITDLDNKSKIQMLEIFLNLKPNDHKHIPINSDFEKGIVKSRVQFTKKLPEHIRKDYCKYLDNKYNPGLSVIDNLLYSRIDTSNSNALNQLQPIVTEAIEETKLKPVLIILFLVHAQAGIGGSRLPEQAKHRIHVGRSLFKRPITIIFHDALSILTPEEQALLITNIREFLPMTSIIWINQACATHIDVDRAYHLQESGISEMDSTQRLDPPEIEITDKYNKELSLIKKLDFFASLNSTQAEFLAAKSQIVNTPKGNKVYTKDSKATHVYVLLKGEASLYTMNDGRLQRFTQLHPGQPAGELEILTHSVYRLTLVADNDSKFLCINAEVIQNLIENNHQLSINILKTIANNLTHSG